jgi:Zn-dependent peptidase ImmA (M78 family)
MLARDFYELIDRNGIEYVTSADAEQGFYYFAEGKHFIVLPSKISPSARAVTAWHEFSHFLQNFENPKPAVGFCDLKANAPGEKLANVFANIATHPEWFGVTGPMDFIRMIMRTKL